MFRFSSTRCCAGSTSGRMASTSMRPSGGAATASGSSRLSATVGRLLAMDRDPEAVMKGRELQQTDSRFVIQQERFGQLRRFLETQGVKGGVDGILFDLGVSSPQLDSPARGFSFQSEGPLDMRMDPASSPSAAEWINAAEEREIASRASAPR